MKRSRLTASYTLMPHYQVYYWLGLAAQAQFSMERAPWWYRMTPWPGAATDVDALSQKVKGAFGRESTWDARRVDQFAAWYRWDSGGRTVTFAIDAHDGKEICSPDLLDRCDIYFKANRWQRESYPDTVLPLVNGNGFLRRRHLKRLKSMRGAEKKRDFLFVSRIWGGMEHNVRLFESLAGLPCRKKLVAVFVEGAAPEQETEAAIRRLEAVGVTCTYDLLPIKELWRACAASRIVMLRAGKYLCIPWRMIDLLCMGSCVVTDADFEPQWPEPLQAGTHYVSAGILRPPDTSAAEAAEYDKLTATIGTLLEDDARIRRARVAGAAYFDDHAAPERVGAYLLDRIESYARSGF